LRLRRDRGGRCWNRVSSINVNEIPIVTAGFDAGLVGRERKAAGLISASKARSFELARYVLRAISPDACLIGMPAIDFMTRRTLSERAERGVNRAGRAVSRE
jgi:hypothetical protein